MKTAVIIFGALFALISFAGVSRAESETQPPPEAPAQKVHVLNPGEREYLSPNLIGVQNIAVTNIPVTLDFVNIVDAFREVVDGVKYEIILNALNTTDNNTDIVCRIVVLEKPWLTTLWGDKVRLLKESNCTSEEFLDNTRDRKSIEEKYETNAIFTGNRNELTADDMNKLESQILGSSKSPQLRRQPSVATSTTTTTTTTTEAVASEDVTESVNIQTEAEAEETVDNVGVTTEEAIVSSSTEEASTTTTTTTTPPTTTTEKLPELSTDEKKWLDDFLSIGAFNFEIAQQKKSESQNNEEQLNDQESPSDKRVARQLVGGVRKLSPKELAEAQDRLAKSLSILAAGDGPFYTIDKIYSASTQVVSGSLDKYDADLVDSKSGDKNRCSVSLWSQPWLQENGYELTFDCKDKEQVIQRHSRSVELTSRSKRSLVGGPKELNEEELAIEGAKVNTSLSKLAAGDGPFYTISKIFRGTKRIVAGTLVTIDAELIDDISGETENCTISLWSRLWIPVDGHEVTFECNDKPKTVYRHSRSVENAQKKTHKKSHRTLNKAEYLFQKFQVKYNKTYHNSMEHQMRMRIFKHNLKLIADLNKHEMGSAKYGVTEFADMTTTEYRERTGLNPREETNAVRSQASIPDIELPKEFDWREKGVVSPVKNQGNCGSCWAFSVTGNIEGLHAVKTGKLEEYSEQELLDCDTIDSACQGGLPDNAYQAIEKIGGLELESEYPYEGKKGSCHYDNKLARVKVSGAVDLPKNETAMAQWLLANGPISIGINANAMQFYRGGVSHPWKVLCAKTNLDHGVLIVGYGVSDYPMFKKTLPYWIVKNSWGPKWGEQGYYRVYRGDNTCGVSEMATSAVLA